MRELTPLSDLGEAPYRGEEERPRQEYTSDISHQDRGLPYRMQITYENGGPSYFVNEYFPHLHYPTAATLAHGNYDILIEYWGTRDTKLADLEAESNAIKGLSREGAFDQLVDVI